MIFTLLAIAVALSLAGLTQSRWRPLRWAVALGWLGPLPAFWYAVWAQHPPFHGVLEYMRQVLPTYFVVIAPVFGPYCFALGLIGGWALGRLQRSARPLAVAALCAASAVPFILWEGKASSGFGLWALIAAGFWTLVLGAVSAAGGRAS